MNFWCLTLCLWLGTIKAKGDKAVFSIEGSLKFPSTGDYSVIPTKSCIRIRVQDDIQCMGDNCEIPTRGYKIIKDFQIINNQVHYKVFGSKGNGYYSLSVTFNVGWCADEYKESIRKGDYQNDFMVNIRMKPDEVEKKDVDADLNFYSIESFAAPSKYVVKNLLVKKDLILTGSVILPKKGVYTNIPERSCLHINIIENIQCENCNIPTLASVKLNVREIKKNTITYAINAGPLKPGIYVVSAVFNIGWCSVEGGSEWLKQGDYFNDVSHEFQVSKDDTQGVVNKDINVREHQKFLCGTHQCFVTENCTTDYKGRPYCQCPPYACADHVNPKYVCGSNGQSYSSDCWMRSSDCFSNTITMKHKGKCGNSVAAFFSNPDNVVGFSIGVVILSILLVVMVGVACLCKNKNILRRTGTVSKDPIMSTNSLSFGEPETTHASVNDNVVTLTKEENEKKQRVENFYVGVLPARYQPSSFDAPSTQPPSYEESLNVDTKQNIELHVSSNA